MSLIFGAFYFYEEYKDYKAIGSNESVGADLNYTFLIKTFNSLSRTDKDKILEVLKNTENLIKSG